ncbi:MAG: peptidase M14 [Acidobacteria bacterium]|nr:peptidase M14 [Acidobacteriota bacterium]
MLSAQVLLAQVPSPREHLGYTPGDDYKLADYADVSGYFRKLAQTSPRIRLEEFGKSANGKPMLVAYISSEENLKQLDRWKALNRKMALGQATEEEARRMSREGKAIVWIDSGLHASEVAPVQHSFDLAYRMVTGEDEETRRIRDRVILLQVPVINPDGLDWIAHWYRRNVGTPYELAPLPHLYHQYAGHDNNRDWFMMNLVETRNVSRMFYEEWFPHIIYNQHQSPAFPARIFVPPYAEPLNPNIPPSVLEGVSIIGAAMRERFAREGKTGVLSYHGYDAWWNGGLRTAPKFHNMHGILTETALHSYATPGEYTLSDLPERFGNGMPTKESSIFYSMPWLGGKWGIRQAIDYMLTADFAILELAATRSDYFLWKAYELARSAVEKGNRGGPYAYVVPAQQWDAPAALDMMRRLQLAGVQVERARAPFQAEGKSWPAGTYVMRTSQPFRNYLVDLMEKQEYPELRTGQSGPTKKPYDVAGWTLPLNMGVEVHRVEDGFEASLESAGALEMPVGSTDYRHTASFRTIAEMLRAGKRVRRSGKGEWLVQGQAGESEFAAAAFEMRAPRVAIYDPYVSNMDAGWTQYVLDDFRVPFTKLNNEAIASGAWVKQFDVLILADQTMTSILHGVRPGQPTGTLRAAKSIPALQRPEYTGGIGLRGAGHIEAFVRGGGTLIAFDSATDLPLQMFPLPLRVSARSDDNGNGYYSPGSIIRIQVDTASPIAWGVPENAYAFASGGMAWDVSLLREFNKDEQEVRSVARYARRDLLASGWISGERAVLGKTILAEARFGKGRVVMFGFRPQFRAQTVGTFKFVLNAIYQSAATPVQVGGVPSGGKE